jgi:hypothetical protein
MISMGGKRRRKDEDPIIVAKPAAIDELRATLSRWSELWAVEDSDVEPGRRLTECLEPFLLDLIQQGLAAKTFARHRDHIEMLGGEIIRRRYDDADLAKQPIDELLSHLIEEEGGPLIWPRITETAQRAFDATCRKLYRFLQQRKQQK